MIKYIGLLSFCIGLYKNQLTIINIGIFALD